MTAAVGHPAPLHAGVVLLVDRAVEVLVLGPVAVTFARQAAAVEVGLDEIDQVLRMLKAQRPTVSKLFNKQCLPESLDRPCTSLSTCLTTRLPETRSSCVDK